MKFLPYSCCRFQICTQDRQNGSLWLLLTCNSHSNQKPSVTPQAKFLQKFPLTTCCIHVHVTNAPMIESLMGFICQNSLRVCEFTSNTFWECVCNRRCEPLATHSGKYLGWFPSECLGVPMECPLPTNSPPTPWLTDCLSLSSPERGARQGAGNGTIHKCDPCFSTTEKSKWINKKTVFRWKKLLHDKIKTCNYLQMLYAWMYSIIIINMILVKLYILLNNAK